TFPSKSFHIAGDCITGLSGHCDTRTDHVWLTQPEHVQNFEFGLSMKAKWYHMLTMEIDEKYVGFSVGHWSNGGTLIMGGKSNKRLIDKKIKNANEWASLKIRVNGTAVTYIYNGETVGEAELAEPLTANSKVKVGFSSSDT